MSSDSNTVVRAFSEVVAYLESPDSHGHAVEGLIPATAVRPGTVDELSEVVRSAHAEGKSIIPWGGGTQMGVGNVPTAYDVALDLSRINEVLRYDADDMTMSVQTGCRLQDLNQMLDEHRQVLPVDAAYPAGATIGGMTAVGASGPRRLGYGPLRDLIIGMSVMSVDGIVTKAGGQVVKNVTGFDMMRLHHGALGSLGLIISINLKVIPKPQSERTVIAVYDSLEQADAAAREVMQSQLGVTALVVTNPSATCEATGESDTGWAIAARCEAPPSAVVRQAERVSGYVAEGAQHVYVEESTEESIARWDAICKALDQRADSPDIAIRIGSAASKLRVAGDAVAATLESIGGGRLTLDYGSGLLYARISRDAVTSDQFAEIHSDLFRQGDHATLMTAPSAMKRDIDVFGRTSGSFSMFEALKQTFDPDRTLNPGRSTGRL